MIYILTYGDGRTVCEVQGQCFTGWDSEGIDYDGGAVSNTRRIINGVDR